MFINLVHFQLICQHFILPNKLIFLLHLQFNLPFHVSFLCFKVILSNYHLILQMAFTILKCFDFLILFQQYLNQFFHVYIFVNVKSSQFVLEFGHLALLNLIFILKDLLLFYILLIFILQFFNELFILLGSLLSDSELLLYDFLPFVLYLH